MTRPAGAAARPRSLAVGQSGGAAGRIETESQRHVAEETGERTGLTPPWLTILWNCDCHSFEQVARQLVKAIGCSHDDAMGIAWRVHNEGKAVVRVAPRSECERVARILGEIGLQVTVAEA